MKTIKRTLALSIAALFAALWLIPVCASAKGGAPAHVWWDGSNASWSVPEDDEPADHYEVYVYKNNAAVYSCAVYELSLDCTDTFKACGTGSYTFKIRAAYSGNVYSDFKSSDAYEYKAGHEHDLVEVPKKDAACTEDGEKKHYECPICGFKAWDKEGLQEITDDSEFVIPAKGHDWGEWKVTKEATTTSEGEKSRVCKNDSSHKETEVIPKKKEESHTEDTTAPTDPPKTTEKPTETTKPTGVVTTPSDNTAPSAAGSSSESKDSSLLRMILIIGGIILAAAIAAIIILAVVMAKKKKNSGDPEPGDRIRNEVYPDEYYPEPTASNGYNPNGGSPNGYDPNGYNPNGYNQNGYNPNGYNQNGYNQNGYKQNGYDPNGYNQNGYNPNGYNQNGYNQNGYNPNGVNPSGNDTNGYNSNGAKPNGFSFKGDLGSNFERPKMSNYFKDDDYFNGFEDDRTVAIRDVDGAANFDVSGADNFDLNDDSDGTTRTFRPRRDR